MVATIISIEPTPASAAPSPPSSQKITSNSETADAERKPLVVEGRTWWYESDNKGSNDPIDYGITIGKSVNLYGRTWNEVKVIKSMLHSSEGVWHDCKDEDIVVGYIREDNSKVYSLPLNTHGFDPIIQLNIYMNEDPSKEMTVYDFSTQGTHFYFWSGRSKRTQNRF